MGLVMSFANPHNANKEVINIKGTNTCLFLVLIVIYPDEHNPHQQ